MDARNQVLTLAQMRAAEQALIDDGDTIASLMERAGRGAADYVNRVAAGRTVTVLCGPGNNGGDGYVIARHLRERGAPVTLIAPLAPSTEAARAACAAWGGEPSADLDIAGAVLVDCLFGSGLTRPLEPALATLLAGLAARHAICIAVDLPSGIDCDTGEALNPGLPHYHLTLALGAWKQAHWLMPAMALMGERRLVDIGLTPVANAARLSERPHLAAPPADAHKYTRGLLAVIGGAMPGASLLAARAAMHAGAGYVKLLAETRPSVVPDELVVDTTPLDQALANERIAALLIGPGLGQKVEHLYRLVSVLKADLPTVCDADALALLNPAMHRDRTAPLVFTPHAGELAKLYQAYSVPGLPRLERLAALAIAARAVIVAKGPDTIVAAPGEPLRFVPPASSWLSTAGTGDVLAGILASRLATGEPPVNAAIQALWLHAGAARLSGAAFTAGDLADHITTAYVAFL